MADCTAVNQIIQHPLFRSELAQIEHLEQNRIFCRHGIEHLLTVAHLAWIDVLEQQLPVSKPLLYATALLHDIGRGKQYRNGTPHERAGVLLAKQILADCAFTEQEQNEILSAISSHRSTDAKDSALAEVLYKADKACRPCFFCSASAECNWSSAKRNLTLEL